MIYLFQSSDAELLGEMMFGSMPMKLAGNTLKIHYVRSEQQLLLTKLFTTQHRMMPSCSVTDFSDSCPLPGESSAQNIENSIGPSTCIPKNRSFPYSLRPPSQSPGKYNSVFYMYIMPIQSTFYMYMYCRRKKNHTPA